MLGSNMLVRMFNWLPRQLIMFQHSYSLGYHGQRIKLNYKKEFVLFCPIFLICITIAVHVEVLVSVDLVLFSLSASAQLSSTFLLFTSF